MLKKRNPTEIVLIEIGLLLVSFLLTGVLTWICWNTGYGCSPGWLAEMFTNGGEAAYDIDETETCLGILLLTHVAYWVNWKELVIHKMGNSETKNK